MTGVQTCALPISETTASILALLRDINRQLGVTIVLITHELEVVKAICDSAVSLAAGRVVESGTLLQLQADPSSRLGRSLAPSLHVVRAV